MPAIHGHGFDQWTVVKKDCGHYVNLGTIYNDSARHKVSIRSYALENNQCISQKIKAASKGTTNCFFRIGLDNSPTNDILCTPSQEFYAPEKKQWLTPLGLEVGDSLLDENGNYVPITRIEFIKHPLKICSIEIENSHNYFVGHHFVLTHNIVIPISAAAGIGCSFGSGATAGGSSTAYFGPVTCSIGIVVGGIIGVSVYIFTADKGRTEINCTFPVDKIEKNLVDNAERAPGVPTEKVGFKPKKNWDGKKVVHPGNGQYGYPAANGKIWVPTGEGPLAHRGPHWDVSYPDGSEHENVMPDGTRR